MVIATDNVPLLAVRGLRTRFNTKMGPVYAVDGVDFTLQSGKVLCIVGESGSGKSVTVRSLLRLVSPPGEIIAGTASFRGEDLLSMSDRRLAAVRGDKIAMVFQNPLTSLNPMTTIGEQVSESLLLHRGMSKAEATEETISLLRQVGIPAPDKRVWDYPAQFSGGMRQRILIAAALSCRPEILIADEPTTALDVSTQAQILNLLRKLQAEISNALIMITHDLGVVASLADDVMIMYAGRVVEQAPVREIFARPRHPYTQGLIDTVKALNDPERPLRPIPGTPAVPLGEKRGCPFSPRCAYAEGRCRSETPQLIPLNPHHIVACHVLPEGRAAHV
jgi:oligopeptide/dipeptide ABC transporter ATP-binding protein